MPTWEVWYPEAAATGLLVARGQLDPTDVLWLHAAPPTLIVTVRDDDDRPVAQGDSLAREGEQLPMTRLWVDAGRVRREDRWPTDTDLGCVCAPSGR